MYRWFINIKLSANSTITQAWMKLIWHMAFSVIHSTALYLGTLDSISALGAILNSEIANKKHKNAENVTLSRLKKGHFSTVWELK